VSEKTEKSDLVDLLARPAFLRLLGRIVQTSGIHAPAGASADLRSEGRRNLGLDILRDVARGQTHDDPEQAFAATVIQVLAEQVQSAGEEKPRGRSSRYDNDEADA
jgi:hypothetical protein